MSISVAGAKICCAATIAPHNIRLSIVQKKQPTNLSVKIINDCYRQSGYVHTQRNYSMCLRLGYRE
jgi:hypothetical protein